MRIWSISCGKKDGRSCRGWPGCPPILRFFPRRGAGLGGFTMSLEGGLWEVEEARDFALQGFDAPLELRDDLLQLRHTLLQPPAIPAFWSSGISNHDQQNTRTHRGKSPTSQKTRERLRRLAYGSFDGSRRVMYHRRGP